MPDTPETGTPAAEPPEPEVPAADTSEPGAPEPEVSRAQTEEPGEPTTGTDRATRERGRSSRDASDEGVKRPSIIDAVADLLQFIVDWLRQEAEVAVREKIVLPVQRLGLTLASALAAALLAALGIGFIAVGVFILLGEWITYPGALLLIGGVLVLGSVVFTVVKMKGIQR